MKIDLVSIVGIVAGVATIAYVYKSWQSGAIGPWLFKGGATAQPTPATQYHARQNPNGWVQVGDSWARVNPNGLVEEFSGVW